MLNSPEMLGGAATALALGSCALVSTFNPRSSFWGPVIWHARSTTNSSVSLTFDDGPTQGCTDRILDLLGELKVPATFFVIGRNVERHPDLLRRIDAEGHLVGNHSYDHGHFDLFRGWAYWNRQFERTSDLIAGTIGKKPAIFRPPMGFTTHPIQHSAKGSRQTVVTWSRRARDGLHAKTADILSRTTRQTRPGDIVLMHDGVDPNLRNARHRDRSATLATIRPLVMEFRNRRLNLVRLDELLHIPGYLPEVAARLPISLAPAASAARTSK